MERQVLELVKEDHLWRWTNFPENFHLCGLTCSIYVSTEISRIFGIMGSTRESWTNLSYPCFQNKYCLRPMSEPSSPLFSELPYLVPRSLQSCGLASRNVEPPWKKLSCFFHLCQNTEFYLQHLNYIKFLYPRKTKTR